MSLLDAVFCCSLPSALELTLFGALLAAKFNLHHRRQSLHFLHICLASVLNLRSPKDSSLPGSALDKLVTMLFTSQVRPWASWSSVCGLWSVVGFHE